MQHINTSCQQKTTKNSVGLSWTPKFPCCLLAYSRVYCYLLNTTTRQLKENDYMSIGEAFKLMGVFFVPFSINTALFIAIGSYLISPINEDIAEIKKEVTELGKDVARLEGQVSTKFASLESQVSTKFANLEGQSIPYTLPPSLIEGWVPIIRNNPEIEATPMLPPKEEISNK